MSVVSGLRNVSGVCQKSEVGNSGMERRVQKRTEYLELRESQSNDKVVLDIQNDDIDGNNLWF